MKISNNYILPWYCHAFFSGSSVAKLGTINGIVAMKCYFRGWINENSDEVKTPKGMCVHISHVLMVVAVSTRKIGGGGDDGGGNDDYSDSSVAVMRYPIRKMSMFSTKHTRFLVTIRIRIHGCGRRSKRKLWEKTHTEA